MELSVLKKPKLVIAIDVGSTYSGYAWQRRDEFEANRNEIHFNTRWGSGALQLHKTTTSIFIEIPENAEGTIDEKSAAHAGQNVRLATNDQIKVKIGHEAERVYGNHAKKDPVELQGRYYYFSKFKTLLYNEGDPKQMNVDDPIGQPLPLFDVMSLFIKALKDHCLKILKTKGTEADLRQTLFVVTVPAIWSNEAKQFMREAAVEAGIGKRNVLLALEPEAAAIYCMHLPEEQRKDMNDLGMKGQKFLVADLGGGTADLSAVKVNDKGYLEELCPPLGGRVGGQKINDAFLQVCHDTFEGDGWKKTFQKVNPSEIMAMEADFENKKVGIGTDDPDGELIALTVPQPVLAKLEDKSIRLKESRYIKYIGNEFMFDSTLVRDKLFKETCILVYGCIENVLTKEEENGLKTVVLVGGFSESPIVVEDLRQKINNKFPNVKVVVPSSPFKAVLIGAVLFGHDPMIFGSRISRETFGIETNSVFDDEKHDPDKKWKYEETGVYYCKDIFDMHVCKGQSVVLNTKQPCKTYFPIYKTQTELGLPIFTSTSLNPKYVTDDGCRQIGKIVVEIPSSESGKEREVEVTMIYGGTELAVIAKDKATGKECNADIEFSSL